MKKCLFISAVSFAVLAFAFSGCAGSVNADSSTASTTKTSASGSSSTDNSSSGTSSSDDDGSSVGTTTKTDTETSTTNGKLAAEYGTGDKIGFKAYCTTDFSVGVWYCYDLDWDDTSTPDVDEGMTAILSTGKDGGYHIVAQKRKCGATYFGCNLAGGSNYGAQADISGAGFTQIRFKVRGTVPASSLYAGVILNLGSDKFVIGQPKASGGKLAPDGKDNLMSTRCSGYNASTWTSCTVPVSQGAATFTYSSAFLMATIDGIPDKSWVEVKDVEWLDKDGNNVAPYKI
jgi:hypothetical protein